MRFINYLQFRPKSSNTWGVHAYILLRGDGRYEKLVGLLYLTNQRAKELMVLFRVRVLQIWQK